jgi:EAL domain-containing protein (putative c-di-GMP-specific phosphodiesterase class I)/GGDEF domain-containing protein
MRWQMMIVRDGAMRLILALRGLGSEVVLIGAAPVLAAMAVGAWGVSPLLGATVGISCVAVTVLLCLRHVRASCVAAELCDNTGRAPGSLLHALEQIKARLSDVGLRLANRHPVTGLPTREHLFQVVNTQIEAAWGPGLLAVLRLADFDRLAAFDPAAADAALTELARRLSKGLSADRTLAQVDRDCIAIWFGFDPVAALREAQSIAYVASQVLEHGDGVLTPTLEIGSATYPADGADASHLLLRATAALAKTELLSTGEVRLRRAESVSTVRESFALEQDLTQAIALDQLTLEYQPVIDLAVGRVVGAEALLRWTHPTLGRVSPARFIPIVESIGLSDHYGLWVLNTASREAARWRSQGRNLRMAINLSARQLQDAHLKTKIERTLANHRLEARALELELTETAAMADEGRTFELFAEIRALGISLAIDDFGSGYSSLSYLKNLPFNKLKIDREFVDKIDERADSRAICKALVELGRGLNLTVLAEGVERQEEVETLMSLGCHVFQGFFFSKPLPPDDLLSWVEASRWTSPRRSSSHQTIQSV